MKAIDTLKKVWILNELFISKKYISLALSMAAIGITAKSFANFEEKFYNEVILFAAGILLLIATTILFNQGRKILNNFLKTNKEIKKVIVNEVREKITSDLSKKYDIDIKNSELPDNNLLHLINMKLKAKEELDGNKEEIKFNNQSNSYDEIINSTDLETIRMINNTIIEKFLTKEKDKLDDDISVNSSKSKNDNLKKKEMINEIITRNDFKEELQGYFSKYKSVIKLDTFDSAKPFAKSKLVLKSN